MKTGDGRLNTPGEARESVDETTSNSRLSRYTPRWKTVCKHSKIREKPDNAGGSSVIRRLSNGRRLVTRAVLLAVVTSLMPLPAFAEERSAPKPGPITAAVEKVSVARMKDGPSVRANAAPRAQEQGTGREGSFFKTKPGIIALAVMAAGVGYAL